MPHATLLPRCPHRVAVSTRTRRVTVWLICFVGTTTATVSLYGQAVDFRFVDPASHMQPWPDVEPEILIIIEDEAETAPPRVARKWQPQLTEPRSTQPPTENRKLPNPAVQKTDTAAQQTGPALQPSDPVLQPPSAALVQPNPTPEPQPLDDVKRQVELLDAPSGIRENQQRQEPIDCYQAPPLSALAAGIALPSGKLPTDVAAHCAEELSPTGDPRLVGGWGGTEYYWSATCMRHRPLYFEEINAERYGYTVSYCLQPVISAARFFATIPALPYKMVVDCPRSCSYTLGHYRPGSCAPRRWHRLPWKLTAGVIETGFIAGMILIIP